jgi:hypothetical protein
VINFSQLNGIPHGVEELYTKRVREAGFSIEV